MKWFLLLAGALVLGVGAWFMVSLIFLLRDYSDIDWGDDEF